MKVLSLPSIVPPWPVPAKLWTPSMLYCWSLSFLLMVQKPPYRGQSLPTKFPSYPKFAIYPQHPFSSVCSDKHHVSSLLTADPWASALDTGFSKLMEHVCLVAQSCLTLCDPTDCSPPGSSVHGILQARILGWIVISFSRGSSQPRKWNLVSRTAGRFFTNWATGKPSMDGEWECDLFVCFTRLSGRFS